MSIFFNRSDGKEIEILYEPYCEVCGEPIPVSYTFNPLCAICRRREYSEGENNFKIRAFGKYKNWSSNDRLSSEILQFKTDQSLCNLLSECLCFALDKMYPELKDLDYIVPVKSSQSAGFNPPTLLAEQLSRKYDFQYADCLLRNYQKVHTGANFEKREEIIRGNITCNKSFNNESVLLIDDVCTTGTTIRECATALLNKNVKEVWALVLGRNVSKEHMEILRKKNEF